MNSAGLQPGKWFFGGWLPCRGRGMVLALAGGGLFLPRKGEPLHALTGGGDWRPAMAGAMHPPFRRKKFRSAPSPPGGEDCARSIPSSSPHKIYDFAGAPLLRKERMRRARWKRENGGAARLGRLIRMSPARGVVQAGFWWSSNRLPSLFAAATLALAGLVRLPLSIGRTLKGRQPAARPPPSCSYRQNMP